MSNGKPAAERSGTPSNVPPADSQLGKTARRLTRQMLAQANLATDDESVEIILEANWTEWKPRIEAAMARAGEGIL